MAIIETREPGTVVADGEAHGLHYVIIISPIGCLNGYVAVPPSHLLFDHPSNEGLPALRDAWEKRKKQPVGDNPAFVLLIDMLGGGDMERDIPTPERVFDVHGGLTYSGRGITGLPETESWWFGFDTSHSGDLWPEPRWPSAKYHDGYREGTYRNEAYVRAECERLAEQLAALM